MHVLTLIGCVLFSDVGPREEGKGGVRKRGRGGRCLCVCARGRTRVCLRNCVCGLDQPPEFTQRLRQD